MTEQAHAEFEAWWNRQPHREQFEDVKDQMRNVWVAGWIDSRQQLVIELPDPREGRTTYLDDDARDEGWNDCLELCVEAVEAAGAKWKE